MKSSKNYHYNRTEEKLSVKLAKHLMSSPVPHYFFILGKCWDQSFAMFFCLFLLPFFGTNLVKALTGCTWIASLQQNRNLVSVVFLVVCFCFFWTRFLFNFLGPTFPKPWQAANCCTRNACWQQTGRNFSQS